MQTFAASWNKCEIERLVRRLETTRIPSLAGGAKWEMGCSANFMSRLKEYWLDEYEFERVPEKLNRFPQYTLVIGGVEIHFLHIEGKGNYRRPTLILTHGWPGSVIEFFEIIAPLAFPSQHGGTDQDAFDLIIPSLPGYGFSGKPAQPIGPRATAALWSKLVGQLLGGEPCLAHGGDWGSLVSSWLGVDFPESVRALHLTTLPLQTPADPNVAEEVRYANAFAAANAQYGAYANLQMTKPNSLALATADNPVGQAAWIVERFHDWCELGGGELEDLACFDTLLDNIMLYVMEDRFSSSLLMYRGFLEEGPQNLASSRCNVPTTYACFPGDPILPKVPRSIADRSYNIRSVSEMPRGGHFPALEQPDLLVRELRRWRTELGD